MPHRVNLPRVIHCVLVVLGVFPLMVFLSACGGGGAPPPPSPTTCTTTVTPSPGVVVTDFGAVQGAQIGGTYGFLGVPYAAPPVGARRWQPPQDPSCSTTTQLATSFAAGCIQKQFDQFSDSYTIVGSEDCLYLNVWTPVNYSGAGKPVMVFIHGGGNQQGAAGQTTAGAILYDGAKLAERGDVVVVTIDYRLGPLGYLAHAALTDSGGHYGNWGLLDQIKALQWVQEHIARFGGDPARVLVFGESAGAVNTCMLLVSPLASGLFTRAAMESGACTVKTLAGRATTSASYVSDLGCDPDANTKECLMALDAAALIGPLQKPFSGGIVTQTFGPAIDGWLLPQDPMTALQTGQFNHMPLLTGSNSDETAVSVPPGTINRIMVLALFAAIPEPTRAGLLAIYDPGAGVSLTLPSAEARDSFIRATTDAQFTCTVRRVAMRAAPSAGQTDAVYRYHFTHRLSGVLGSTYGAYHGHELFYVFQNIEDSSFAPSLTADDTAVEQLVLGYWTRFAASGNPNGAAAVAWPTYDNTDPYLTLAAAPLAGAGLLTNACDLWDVVAAQ